MAMLKTKETYEDRRDPVFINQAALEAEHSTINKLLRADKRRTIREWILIVVIGVMAVTVWDEVSNDPVYAWRITEGLDGVERTEFVEPFKVEAGLIADESRQWLQHVRMVSSDPVAQDKLRNTARRRMDTKIQSALLEQYFKNQVDMPSKGTRDVLENTFGFTQLSNGEKGLYTFVWSWYEREYFSFIPRNGMEMQATVEMRVRPPTAKEQRAGKLEPLFISYFDIRAKRSLALEELDSILAAQEKRRQGE